MIWLITLVLGLVVGFVSGLSIAVIYYNLKKPIIKTKRLEVYQRFFSKVTGTKIEQNIN